jgi:radical SAM superfamily enzyme YgiQ (UPF0313 family)
MEGHYNDFFEAYAGELLKDIDIEKYDLLAFSVGANLSWVEIHSALILGKFIKTRYQKIQVIGGININSAIPYSPVYDELLRHFLENFQYVIHGPGEEALFQIINALNQGKRNEDIKKINGVGYMTGDGKPCFNKEEKKRIICPDFDGLDLDYYCNYLNKHNRDEAIYALYCLPSFFTMKLRLSPVNNTEQYERRLVIPYVFNYGCPYSCAFCTESAPETGAPVIGKVENVINHLETLTNKYRTPYFYFINNAVN